MSPITPLGSFQVPRNNSPRNGFNGFFSEPLLVSVSVPSILFVQTILPRHEGIIYSFSFLELYCCFSVDKNHFSTARALFCGSFSCAGATKISGCSAWVFSTTLISAQVKGGQTHPVPGILSQTSNAQNKRLHARSCQHYVY